MNGRLHQAATSVAIKCSGSTRNCSSSNDHLTLAPKSSKSPPPVKTPCYFMLYSRAKHVYSLVQNAVFVSIVLIANFPVHNNRWDFYTSPEILLEFTVLHNWGCGHFQWQLASSCLASCQQPGFIQPTSSPPMLLLSAHFWKLGLNYNFSDTHGSWRLLCFALPM